MAAAAAQKAPETKRTQNAKPQARQQAPKIARPAGIAIMVLLLMISLAVGNGRALSKATPKAFLRQGDVAALLTERVNGAKNAETVAKRADLETTIYSAVDLAADALSSAKTAREVSRADQKLTSAVGDMVSAASGYFGENADLTRAMDTYNDAGNMLRQEARAYNEAAKKAQKVYEGLPLRFLFGEPDVYEGI